MRTTFLTNEDKVELLQAIEKIIAGSGGVSPIVTISEIQGGYTLTIADVDGLKEIDIMHGEKGETPVKGVDYEDGKPFTYDMFTPEQLEALKGPKGEAFKYEDFTQEQLDDLERGAKAAQSAAEQAAAAAQSSSNKATQAAKTATDNAATITQSLQDATNAAQTAVNAAANAAASEAAIESAKESIEESASEAATSASDAAASLAGAKAAQAAAEQAKNDAQQIAGGNYAPADHGHSYNDLTDKPTGLATEEYVDNKFSSIPTPDVSGQINTHNTASNAHSDIRTLISTAQATADAALPKTGGTFAGQIAANASGQSPSTALLRNTKLVASETTPTVNGEIFWTYG